MQRRYKYLDFVMVAFVTVLLTSNIIGPAKVAIVFGFEFGAGVFFFPFSYIFGDILTEVYGYARTRRTVWVGFAALAFASFMSYVIVSLPPSPNWKHQEAYEIAFGMTPRIALASLIGYWAGEFANSYVIAKMKIWSKGKYLWSRTIGSTVVGQAVDSLIFYPFAFYGYWGIGTIIQVTFNDYLLKVFWEAIMTPFTYIVVHFLKRAEQEDYYDYHTNFTPFSLKDE
ncbi:MAG: queuosine precursor transporter [Leptospiraceae bacterium]|nr:queuosine precursor transporter [Leptospiraceae bacterium]MDW7976903.1 queuosine precursor transporter [Leptospiraceae bacterium]